MRTLGDRTTPWLVVGFSALCGSVSLIYPFGRDQGTYAYAGWVLLDGGMPYRDAFVIKPPMTLVNHAIAMGAFGVNTWAIRLFDVGWTAATALAIGALANELWGRREAAVMAALAYPFLYYQLDYWTLAQTDGWMVLPGTLVLWLSLRSSRYLPDRSRAALWLWAGAGASLAIAMLYKYTAVTMGLPWLVALASVASKHGSRTWPRALVAALLGASVVLGAAVLWLFATGAWQPFVEIQREMVVPYAGRRSDDGSFVGLIAKLFRFGGARADLLPLAAAGLLAIVPAVLGARALGRAGTWGLGVALAWWLSATASLVLQGKFFKYHYLPLIGPTALLIGLAASWVWPKLAVHVSHSAARLAMALLVTTGLVALNPIGSRFADLVAVASGAESVERYVERRREYAFPSYRVAEVREAAERVRRWTTDEERILVWGFEPTMYIRAERRAVSRFFSNGPFRPHWRNEAWDRELLAALRASPPTLFVVGSGDRFLGLKGSYEDSAALLRSFGELYDFVDGNYSRVDRVGRYALWRLDEPAPAAEP